MRYRALILLTTLSAMLGTSACAKILGLRDEEAREFPHRAHAIQGINCVQCHGGVLAAGEEGELHLPDAAACRTCHAEPDDPDACYECFTRPETRRDAAARKHHLTFRHDEHLTVNHGDCMGCHLGIAGEDANVTAPMGACLGCHEHRDEFRVRQCEQCHVDLTEEAAIPETHIVHDDDFLRRHGMQASSASDLCATCHQESFCLSCHGVNVPALPSRLNMNDPMGADMHRANFFARHSMEAHMDPGLCTTCHASRFCTDCHARSEVRLSGAGGISPHPSGWVGALGSQNEHGRAARLDPVSCASCHGGAGEALCVQCHAVGGIGGNPHPSGFDSRLGLDEMPCRMCHSPTGMP